MNKNNLIIQWPNSPLDQPRFFTAAAGAAKSSAEHSDNTKNSDNAKNIESTNKAANGEPLAQALMAIRELSLQQAEQEFTQGSEVGLILPCLYASNQRLALSPKQKKALNKAFPYLLEDELLQPIDTMHCVYRQLPTAKKAMAAPSDTTGPGSAPEQLIIHCVSVAKSLMTTVRDFCSGRQWQLQAVYIDADLLPQPEQSQAHILTTDSGLLVKQASAEFFQTSSRESPLLQQLQCKSLQLEASESNRYLVSRVFNTTAVNLLSGEYALQRQGGWQQLLKPAAVAMAVLLTAQLLYWLGAAWFYNHQASQLDNAARAQYQEFFPQDKRIIDVRSQAMGHLKKINQAGADSKLLSLLGQFANIKTQQQSAIELYSIRYNQASSQAVIELTASSVKAAEALVAALNQQNIQAELSQARKDGDKIKARIKIRL